MKKFIVAAIAASALLIPTAAAHADTTCMANSDGVIMAHHVSCSRTLNVLTAVNRSHNVDRGRRNFGVFSGGHYWLCKAQYSKNIVACAYDGSHSVGFGIL